LQNNKIAQRFYLTRLRRYFELWTNTNFKTNIPSALLTWRLNSQVRHAGLDQASSVFLDSRLRGNDILRVFIRRSNIWGFLVYMFKKVSHMDDRTATNTDGFSLVELIASLTIAGILAVALMTIVVTALNGFSLSKDAAGVTQKGNLALSRIRVELLNATSITTAEANRIIYKTHDGTYEILKTGNVITLEKTDAGSPIPAKTLVDNILADYGTDSFLSYEKRGGSTWATSDDMLELYAITLMLKFTNYANALETMINPRMNRVRNAPLLVMATVFQTDFL
jgi:prepilin-type N-terminal cleavage/methylation domain-containing protein